MLISSVTCPLNPGSIYPAGDDPSNPTAQGFMPPQPSPFDQQQKSIVRRHLLIGNDAVLGLREDGKGIHQNSSYGGLLVREAILCVLLQLQADLPQHPWIAQQLRKFSNKIETRVGTIEAEIAELQSQIEELQSQIHNKRCAIPQFDTRLKDTLKQYLTQSEVEPTAEDSDLVSED